MIQIRNAKRVKDLTYVDAGCRRVESVSRNGFICSYDGFNGEGFQQIRLFQFPFDTSCPEITSRKERCGCTFDLKEKYG